MSAVPEKPTPIPRRVDLDAMRERVKDAKEKKIRVVTISVSELEALIVEAKSTRIRESARKKPRKTVS